MSAFVRNNLSVILSFLSSLLMLGIHAGITQAKLENNKESIKKLEEYTEKRIDKIEVLSREDSKVVAQRLDELTKQVATVVTILKERQIGK